MSKVQELFGLSTFSPQDWRTVVEAQHCPWLDRKCLKTRKSAPELSIGTCTVAYGAGPVMICPIRLLAGKKIFSDCIHLLTLHEPGNELHVVGEIEVPGGSIDYCLASVRKGKTIDFVGIELQTLDTTGTVWPERQRFLREAGIKVKGSDAKSAKSFGMNWKMTAKTILVQLHHKIETFESISKHLVLVLQDCLMVYMRKEFSFGHLEAARAGDPMHFHAYSLSPGEHDYRLELEERLSTDGAGIARCLGLQSEAKMEVQQLLSRIDQRISDKTLLSIASTNIPPPSGVDPEE